MPPDPTRDEQESQDYELRTSAEERRELEHYQIAVGLLIISGLLSEERWQQALELAKGLK